MPTKFQISMGKNFIKTVLPLIDGILGPKFAHNTTHPQASILKAPVYAAILKIHIEEGATRLRDINPDENPSPDIIFRRPSELTKEPAFYTFDIRPEL